VRALKQLIPEYRSQNSVYTTFDASTGIAADNAEHPSTTER
jgi:hypothetical protein